ncbi:MAG: tetratricopeptide repeat protein [Bacteroidota bacterium]
MFFEKKISGEYFPYLSFRMAMLTLFLFSSFFAFSQQGHKFLLRGDQSYQDQNFEQAELNYRRALERENSTQGTYNLGNSTYKLERFDEAVAHFEAAAESAVDDNTKAQAFHNLGNAHYQAGQYKESVEAFKNSLRLNPNDLSTKQNLIRAIRKLPPPQQNQQQQQGENQDNKDQNQQQQNQQQNQQNEQDEQQNQNDEQKEEEQNQSSKQQQQESRDLSKEEAEQLLEIMDQEEQKVQEKLRKAGAKKKRTRDW